MSVNEAYLEDLREARELEEVLFAGRCTTALLLRFIEMITSLHYCKVKIKTYTYNYITYIYMLHIYIYI